MLQNAISIFRPRTSAERSMTNCGGTQLIRTRIKYRSEPSPPNPSPGTPFEDNQHQPIFTFNVPTTPGGVKSGEPIPGAVGKYFAYGIKDNNGNVCKDASSADPGVNIKP